jgi:uncharacterized membrane protein SpoIIM required for sporulation
MTPLQFETGYRALWDELDAALTLLEGGPKRSKWSSREAPDADPARVAALYRATCEHLALARARAYPVHLTERLEALTQRGHQAVYHRRSSSAARLSRLFLVDIPQAVRAHRAYMWVATLVFALPLFVLGVITYFDPGFVLTLNDAATVRQFDSMYSESGPNIGRARSADTDWGMFGFYIMHNIGIAFQCFAGGVFFGIGSLFFLAFNGAFAGTVAGYLTARGHTETFYSFVVTHGAFELTAIVISGAAGLALGHALLAPGRHTRVQALRRAAADAVLLLYLVIAMLVIAAAVEAFWSSSRWVEPWVKYGVGAACWVLVLGYLGWQGKPRGAAPPRSAHAG